MNASEGANVKIMPLKAFGANGAYTSDIIRAIEFAEANGARIANFSFGSSSYNTALEDTMAAPSTTNITRRQCLPCRMVMLWDNYVSSAPYICLLLEGE